MKTKMYFIALATVLSIGLLTGCGSKSPTKESSEVAEVTAEPTELPTAIWEDLQKKIPMEYVFKLNQEGDSLVITTVENPSVYYSQTPCYIDEATPECKLSCSKEEHIHNDSCYGEEACPKHAESSSKAYTCHNLQCGKEEHSHKNSSELVALIGNNIDSFEWELESVPGDISVYHNNGYSVYTIENISSPGEFDVIGTNSKGDIFDYHFYIYLTSQKNVLCEYTCYYTPSENSLSQGIQNLLINSFFDLGNSISSEENYFFNINTRDEADVNYYTGTSLVGLVSGGAMEAKNKATSSRAFSVVALEFDTQENAESAKELLLTTSLDKWGNMKPEVVDTYIIYNNYVVLVMGNEEQHSKLFK